MQLILPAYVQSRRSQYRLPVQQISAAMIGTVSMPGG